MTLVVSFSFPYGFVRPAFSFAVFLPNLIKYLSQGSQSVRAVSLSGQSVLMCVFAAVLICC